jgi:hypothetical protein
MSGQIWRKRHMKDKLGFLYLSFNDDCFRLLNLPEYQSHK